uniref:Uncharacterized protein n=1 Tax=Anopheles farauti TaxID=69004 RepID=A0A182QN66_9DIPT
MRPSTEQERRLLFELLALGMSSQFLQTWATLVLLSWAVLAASLPLQANRSHGSTPKANGTIVGSCGEHSRLLYFETVVILKDDVSLVRGSVQINVGHPMMVHCARVVSKSEGAQRALLEQKMVGPKVVEISFAEQPAYQEPALEYTVYLYGSLGAPKTA